VQNEQAKSVKTCAVTPPRARFTVRIAQLCNSPRAVSPVDVPQLRDLDVLNCWCLPSVQMNNMKQSPMHVTFADASSVASESFGSNWGGKRDYGATEAPVEQGAQQKPPPRARKQRRVTFFRNKPSLTIDFGIFAFSSFQRDIAWYSLYCVIYIALAVVAFSCVFEKWSIVDSVYFAVTTFTTTGFGDKV